MGDVRNQNLVADVMKRYEATAVLHFAAASLVGESASKPLEYYDNNVAGAISLVTAMRLRRLAHRVLKHLRRP